MRTLLFGHPGITWREWRKNSLGSSDLLCLDPADPVTGFPGRIALIRNGKPIWTRFIGSLDAQRAPHVVLAAAFEGIAKAEEKVVIQAPAYRVSPVLRQTLLLLANQISPDRILLAEGTPLDSNGFPIGPETIELEAAFQPIVQLAQRKATLLQAIETCEVHEVDLRRVIWEGGRIGTGTPIPPDERKRLGIEWAVYAENQGSTFYAVTNGDVEPGLVARGIDVTHSQRASLVDQKMFENLVCSFGRPDGEEIGYGFIRQIDWESRIATIANTAVAPAPVHFLRTGTLRVDRNGSEQPELKPWLV